MTGTGVLARPAVGTAPAGAPRENNREKRTGVAGFVWTWIVLLWLFLPIAVMIAFGFNATNGRFNYIWKGFTFHWYAHVFANADLTTSLENSLTIAVASTAVATVLGGLMGLALGRRPFRGRAGIDLLLFANIAAPEVVLGAALLSLFLTLGIPRGWTTIFLAHVMFNIAYIAVTVRARMAGFDVTQEEAAQDLGAGPLTTFRLVTLPQIMPGLISGALLAFALSIDDYITTSFVNGQTETFPLWVFGSTKNGTPPQVNVIGTLIFVFGVTVAVGNAVWMRRAERRRRPAPA
jgi:spermidine/putrescine transport system permease protein